MKKILTIAVAVFTFTAVFSQEEPVKKVKTFSIGPSIGFGHAAVRNTYETDLFKPSWNVGIILNYSTSEHIGFAADVLWSMEGSRAQSSSAGPGSITNLSLQYIRVPLKFAYFFGKFEDNLRPKITVGPSVGFLVDADSELEGHGSTDVKSYYDNFDIGLNASAGFNWKLRENIWLNADLNYYTGFVAIRGEKFNTNLGLKVGLAFGL